MRPRLQTFEQLVNENKKELLQDEEKLSQIEIRLEKKQESKQKEKQQKRFTL